MAALGRALSPQLPGNWGYLSPVVLRVFGLTGGIGSGKSTVAQRLRARGLPVVNADQLAREVVLPGSAGLARVVARFGSGVLTASGELDRARLGQLVFSNAAARKSLDAIVHPLVRELAATRFRAIDADGEPLAAYEVPLLYEVGLDEMYQPVVVVTAPLAQRKLRLAARDGLDEVQIAARIAAQMPLEDQVRRADYVIDNAGSVSDLNQQSDAVLDALCADLAVPSERYPQPPLS